MCRATQLLGTIAHLGCIALWCALLIVNPYEGAAFSAGTYTIVMGMIAASVTGIWACMTFRPRLMAGLSVLAFFPVGLYLAGTPGWFAWIAALNLMTFLAALLLARLCRPKAGHVAR
jgi:hypothetical protein